MTKSMIIIDLDGTLLTSSSTVLPTTKNILKLCKSKGYYIGFVTARSRSKKTLRLLETLPYDFIVFYNGALIYAHDQLIESNSLPYQQADIILKKLNQDYSNMVIDMNQEPWFYSNKYNEIYHMDLGYKRTCSINNLPQNDVQRIRLRLENLMCIPIENYMSDDSIFFRTTHGDAIIVHKKATKGHAVQKASEIFNIPFAQIIAFGDDTNDIDMLSIVGAGIAMGNANFELKKISNYVTETNDNNGIASWIVKYLI